MAWSDAARAAALEVRRAHAGAKRLGNLERAMNRTHGAYPTGTKLQTLKVFARARLESRRGYVQHVQWDKSGNRLQRSDWYDAGKTLASYEGGRVLSSNPTMNSLIRGMGGKKKGRR